MITYKLNKTASDLASLMEDQMLKNKTGGRNELILAALQKIAYAAQLFDELGHNDIAEDLTSKLEQLG